MSDDPVLAVLARLEGKFDRLEDGQTRLRVDLMERMDRLQERADAIDGLLTAGLGHADEAHAQARRYRKQPHPRRADQDIDGSVPQAGKPGAPA